MTKRPSDRKWWGEQQRGLGHSHMRSGRSCSRCRWSKEELRGNVAPLPRAPRVGPHGEQELVKMRRTTSCSDPQDLPFLGFPTSPTKPLLLTYGTWGSRTPWAQLPPYPTVLLPSHPVSEAWHECPAFPGTVGGSSQARRLHSKKHSC